MTGMIQYNFHEISNAGHEITTLAGNLQTLLGDLKSRVQKDTAQWEGANSTEYQTAQHQWDTSAADLQEVLAVIGKATVTAAEDAQANDNKNAQGWAS